MALKSNTMVPGSLKSFEDSKKRYLAKKKVRSSKDARREALKAYLASRKVKNASPTSKTQPGMSERLAAFGKALGNKSLSKTKAKTSNIARRVKQDAIAKKRNVAKRLVGNYKKTTPVKSIGEYTGSGLSKINSMGGVRPHPDMSGKKPLSKYILNKDTNINKLKKISLKS